NLADIRDIAAMKIDAIASRGLKRDFIDLYFICKTGYKMTDLFEFYHKKYRKLSSNFIHIKKSLVFFDDADPDEMPRMLKKVKWEEMKKYFVKEVRKI
ncbi:MAG: nucleotidyl transferase AbiEii/AbiGii toxin family protein, partial [Desulfobacterales bacterium]|nr:nucleotidyl transferase AbiEii/AbiGii toxin family protein [Desulfobacterales bacterium]